MTARESVAPNPEGSPLRKSLEIFAGYVPGDEPVFYGLNRQDGTLAVIACFNNDLENFWDWIGSPAYPTVPASLTGSGFPSLYVPLGGDGGRQEEVDHEG